MRDTRWILCYLASPGGTCLGPTSLSEGLQSKVGTVVVVVVTMAVAVTVTVTVTAAKRIPGLRSTLSPPAYRLHAQREAEHDQRARCGR